MSIGKRVIKLGLAAILGAGISNTAFAAATTKSSTIESNGACVGNGGGLPRQFGELMGNDSTTANAYVDCSVPIATASVSDLAESAVLAVYVNNVSTSETLKCSFNEVSANGFIIMTSNSGSQSVSPGTSPSTPLLFYTAPFHLFAPSYVSCKIPKKTSAGAVSGVYSLNYIYTVWPD